MSKKERIFKIIINRKTQLTVSLICLINYLLLTIGVISPAVITYTRDKVLHVTHFYGLWAECAYIQEVTSYCESWENSSLSGTMKACQALAILSFVLMTCAVIGIIVHVLHEKKLRFRFTYVAICVLFFCSGLFIIITNALFSDHHSNIRETTTTTAWAGYFNYFSGVISLISGSYFTIVYHFKQKEFVKTPKEAQGINLVVVKEKDSVMLKNNRQLPPVKTANTSHLITDGIHNLEKTKNNKLPPIKK